MSSGSLAYFRVLQIWSASIGRAHLSGSPDTLSYHNMQAGVQQPEEQDCKYWHFQVDRKYHEEIIQK